MAKLNTIVRYLNSLFKPRSISDVSRNGLQFKGKSDVKKIAFAVDACLDSFKKAKAAGADILVVHHGLFWKGEEDDDILKKRISFLKKNGLSLYAMHLPLDRHPMYGHNIHLSWRLGLKNIKPFGEYKGQKIGYHGNSNLSLKQIKSVLDRNIKTKSVIYNFSKGKARNIAIISGRGTFALPEASKKNIDCMITGELSHEYYLIAKDANVSVIQIGHYASETIGLKVLMKLIKQKFNISTVFLDIPTGL